jgi:hypothetical protein
MSCDQNAGQNDNIKTANKSFANVAKFKCLGMTVRNKDCIHEEIQNRLNLGNNCYYSVQNLLSISYLKTEGLKKYKTIILPVVLYGC